MDDLSLGGAGEETWIETINAEGKRSRSEGSGEDGRPAMKKQRSIDELFMDFLAEWDDSVDGGRTYHDGGSDDEEGVFPFPN